MLLQSVKANSTGMNWEGKEVPLIKFCAWATQASLEKGNHSYCLKYGRACFPPLGIELLPPTTHFSFGKWSE